MIAHINGKLIQKTPNQVIIECGGVGYAINISLNTFSRILDKENCKLLTYLAIKEDAHVLYGFNDEEERALFKHLISVNGVGTNTAIMLLSSTTPHELKKAVVSEDVNLLKTIKGIGPKTAQRLILELKDKLKTSIGEISKGDFNTTISAPQNTTLKSEALSALMALGFSRYTVEKVINDIMLSSNDTLRVEDLIKLALKRL